MAGASKTRARTPAARKAAAKRARARRQSRMAPLTALGRGIAAIWRAIARLIGGIARTLGRNAATARDLDPEHRRDGAGLGVMAFGAISAMAIWAHAAGLPPGSR
jgi:DNA segregation ATPase FtsK/SpoIIIE, S-DNA-T family